MSCRQVAPAQSLPVFCLVAPRACEIGARSPGGAAGEAPFRFILTSEANNPGSLNCKTPLGPPDGEKERAGL